MTAHTVVCPSATDWQKHIKSRKLFTNQLISVCTRNRLFVKMERSSYQAPTFQLTTSMNWETIAMPWTAHQNPFTCSEWLLTNKLSNRDQLEVAFHLSGLAGPTSQFSKKKWNARILRTGSGKNGPAHRSELLSSSTPVGQCAEFGKLRRENVCTCLKPFHSKRPEPFFRWLSFICWYSNLFFSKIIKVLENIAKASYNNTYNNTH